MTYQDICKKLGFDPVVDGYDYQLSDHEDDTQKSPFSVLTDEESDFLLEYLLEHRSELKNRTSEQDQL